MMEPKTIDLIQVHIHPALALKFPFRSADASREQCGR
jgi:hypothetical protein